MANDSGMVPFGPRSCSSIEVEPFEPICDYDHPAGTSPLTLDVPVLSFVPSVPPNECTCLAFAMASKYNPTILPANEHKNPELKIEIKQQDADCCTGAYVITPFLEIPSCSLPDVEGQYVKKDLDTLGSYIEYKLSRKDCGITADLRGTIRHPAIPAPCIPVISTESFKLNVTYTDKDGQEVTPDPAEFKIVNKAKPGECPEWEFEDADLDLGTIGGESGGEFGSDGDVFKDSDDDNLYIDGSENAETTWYGGGIGDRKTDTPGVVESRGDTIRGYVTSLGSKNDGSTDITCAEIPVQKLISDDGESFATKWRSGRKEADEDEGYHRKEEEGDAYRTGNLSMVVPTGEQWHENGLAFTLSHFMYNGSGVLSYLEEENLAVLVSPSPALSADKQHNASGLTIFPATDEDMSPGLSINDGQGLRIYGIDYKTTDTTLPEARRGQLEVYSYDSDFAFQTGTGHVGRMVLNDGKSSDPVTVFSDTFDGFARGGGEYVAPMILPYPDPTYYDKALGFYWPKSRYITGADIQRSTYQSTFPTAEPGEEYDGATWSSRLLAIKRYIDYGLQGYIEARLNRLDGWISELVLGFLHTSSSGLVLSIDGTDGKSPVTRNADG